MAVDSSLFAADIPAGSYAVGDVVNLVNIAGPANVRSGRGAAILKQVVSGRLTSANPQWEIHVKNSDWIDDMVSMAGQLLQPTALDDHSGLVQFGCENQLTPNSGWQVYAVCIIAGTSTAADSLFALIDIDYPSVSAIVDPDKIVGLPTSIVYDMKSQTIHAAGTMTSATWSIQNVDYLKAGFQYCLQSVEVVAPGMGGFLAFSNAAGMGGLQRIIPVNNNIHAIRHKIRYASKMEKGPMDVKLMMFAASATTADVLMVHDYVKRSV